jgi:hypothetical protein
MNTIRGRNRALIAAAALAVAMMAGPMMANASTAVATYTSADLGGLVADFTLDYTGSPTGYANSGSGTIQAPGLNGGNPLGLTLIVAGDPGTTSANPDQFGLTAICGGGCWNFDNIWNDGGQPNPPPSYLGYWGLVFSMTDGTYFNIWDQTGGNGPYNGARILDENGAATYVGTEAQLSAVPVPAAAWLFGSALGVLKVFRRRPA